MSDEKRVGLKGGPPPGEPRDIGDDQAAGYHAGENFLPRTGHDIRDNMPADPAEQGREASVPYADTEWERRAEAGEESVPVREGPGPTDVNDEVFPQTQQRPRR